MSTLDNIVRMISGRGYIGAIDPGKSGGLSILNLKTGRIQSVHHVPLLPPKKGETKREIDYETMCTLWGDVILHCGAVAIEHLWGAAPRGQNRRDSGPSQFKLGYCAGFQRGLVMRIGCPITMITPQSWRKESEVKFLLSDKDSKDGSFRRVRELFPESTELFKRVTVDEGVAEATLIAYALRLRILAGGYTP